MNKEFLDELRRKIKTLPKLSLVEK